MKKFLAAMFACTLAFTTCFAVVGCGGGDDAETPAAETPAAGEGEAGSGEEPAE